MIVFIHLKLMIGEPSDILKWLIYDEYINDNIEDYMNNLL